MYFNHYFTPRVTLTVLIFTWIFEKRYLKVQLLRFESRRVTSPRQACPVSQCGPGCCNHRHRESAFQAMPPPLLQFRIIRSGLCTDLFSVVDLDSLK